MNPMTYGNLPIINILDRMNSKLTDWELKYYKSYLQWKITRLILGKIKGREFLSSQYTYEREFCDWKISGFYTDLWNKDYDKIESKLR